MGDCKKNHAMGKGHSLPVGEILKSRFNPNILRKHTPVTKKGTDMKFWIDTEYMHNGHHVDLISLGVVSQDNREFYAISTEFDAASVKPWIQENVMPHLDPRDSPAWKPLSQIRDELVAFVGDGEPEFWSYVGTCDWYMVTNLFPGCLDGRPANWPMECWDLKQWAFHLGKPVWPDWKTPHHALEDAKRHRMIYDFLVEYEGKNRCLTGGEREGEPKT